MTHDSCPKKLWFLIAHELCFSNDKSTTECFLHSDLFNHGYEQFCWVHTPCAIEFAYIVGVQYNGLTRFWDPQSDIFLWLRLIFEPSCAAIDLQGALLGQREVTRRFGENQASICCPLQRFPNTHSVRDLSMIG